MSRKQSKRSSFYARQKLGITFRDIRHPDYDSIWPDDDDGFDCTRCAGRGYREVDDPFWETGDEFGEVECDACSGTGERAHQTVF